MHNVFLVPGPWIQHLIFMYVALPCQAINDSPVNGTKPMDVNNEEARLLTGKKQVVKNY